MKLLPAIASVAALFVFCIGGAHAQACKSPVPDSALVKKGTLTMSVNPTLPPMQFVDSTGQSSIGTLFAMATLSITPLVGFFLASQRLLTQGIATTGLK